MASQQWMLDLGLEDPSINEYIQHPFLRQIATFFSGLLFASSAYYLAHSPTSSSIFRHLLSCGSLKYSSASSTSSDWRFPGGFDPLSLVFLLDLVVLTTSATQFASLLAFDTASGQVGCTFVVAWTQLGSQTIRLLGLFKLAFSLHHEHESTYSTSNRRSTPPLRQDLELGVLGQAHDARPGVERMQSSRIRKNPNPAATAEPVNPAARRVVRSRADKQSVASKFERYTIWLALFLLAVVMFLSTAVSTGVLRPIKGVNEKLSWCYTRQFVLGNSTMTGMNLLLELYILGRLLLSIRSRARVDPITASTEGLHTPLTRFLKRPSILNIQRALSLLILDAVTLYPNIFSNSNIHVLLQFAPFSAATIIVLYTFNQRPSVGFVRNAISEMGNGSALRLSAPISLRGEPLGDIRQNPRAPTILANGRRLSASAISRHPSQYNSHRTDPPPAPSSKHTGLPDATARYSTYPPPEPSRRLSVHRPRSYYPNMTGVDEMGTVGISGDVFVATVPSKREGAESTLPSSIRIPTPDFSPFLHMASSSVSTKSSVSSLHLREGSVGEKSVGKSLLDPMQETSPSTNQGSPRKRRRRSKRADATRSANVGDVLHARQQHLLAERQRLEQEESNDDMEIMVIDEHPDPLDASSKAKRTALARGPLKIDPNADKENNSESRRIRAQRRAVTIYQDAPSSRPLSLLAHDDDFKEGSGSSPQRSLTWAGPMRFSSLGRMTPRDSRIERSGSATASSRMSPGVLFRMSSTDEMGSTGTSVRDAVVLTAHRARVAGVESPLVRLSEGRSTAPQIQEDQNFDTTSVGVTRMPSRSRLQKQPSSRATALPKLNELRDEPQQGSSTKQGGLYNLLPGFRFRRPIQTDVPPAAARQTPSPLPLPPQRDVIDIRRSFTIPPSQATRSGPLVPRQILPRQVEVADRMQASANQQRLGTTGSPLPSADLVSSFSTSTPLGPPRPLVSRGVVKSFIEHNPVEDVDDNSPEDVSTALDDRLQTDHRASQDSAVLLGSDILLRPGDHNARQMSHNGSSNAASIGHGSEVMSVDEGKRAARMSNSSDVKTRQGSRPSTGASDSARPRTLESLFSAVGSDGAPSTENAIMVAGSSSLPGRKLPSTLRISAIGGGRGRSGTWGSVTGPGTTTSPIVSPELPRGSSTEVALTTVSPRRPRSSSEIEPIMPHVSAEERARKSERSSLHIRGTADHPNTSGGSASPSRPGSLSSRTPPIATRHQAATLSDVPPLPRRPSPGSSGDSPVHTDANDRDPKPPS